MHVCVCVCVCVCTFILPPAPHRFVPMDWSGKTELTLEEVNRLNKLNLELAGILALRNPIYTPFQHGNFTCIMIKEVWEGRGAEGRGGEGVFC